MNTNRISFIRACWRLFAAFSVAVVAASQPPGEVRGVVVDARGGEALSRVDVQLAGAGRRAITDAQGRFALDAVPPGDYILHVSTVGYRTLKSRFSLGAGEIKEFEVVLSPETLRHTESVEVTAGPFETARQDSPSELTLAGTELKNLASVLADDPLRSVQALPGVASSDDFDSRFSLRGAAWRRIGLYVDDILVHAPFHMVGGEPASGSLTIFNGDMVEEIALHSAAYPARYADRTAGVLDVRTREGARSRPSARITASASNAGILAEGPMGQAKRGSWLAAARKSYLQYIIQRTTSSTDPALAFGFTDVQGKLHYEPARNHALNLSAVDGVSDLDRTRGASRLGINSVITGGYRFTLVNVGWRYAPSGSFMATQRAAFLRERFDNHNRDNLELAAGHYGEWVWNGATSWTWRGQNTLDAGWSLRRLRDDGFLNRYQFNPFAVRRLDEYRGNGVRAGGFVEPSWSGFAGRLRLSAGLRWDRHSVDDVQAFSPRASVAWTPRASTRFHLGWGQYLQFPELQFLFSRTGARDLLPERANHAVAAWEQRFGERTRLRAELYQRWDRDLLFRPLYEPRLVAGRIFNPPLDAPVRNSVRGYARGFDVFLQRRSANRLTGWISYSLSYARLRDGEAGIQFPADEDQRHTVNVYAGYRLRPTVNLSAKFLYGSGFPLPGFYRWDGTRYFLSESRNALRLDPYQRADFRINKSYSLDRCRIALYGEVVNLLNRRNYRFDSFNGYNARTGQASLTLDKMFPILPSAGIVIEF